jgi:hypothetical protein
MTIIDRHKIAKDRSDVVKNLERVESTKINNMEARTGIEPMSTDLQSAA